MSDAVTQHPLGPLQGMRDAWDRVHDQVMAKPSSHFRISIGIQMDEVDKEIAKGNGSHAAKEMVDILSVTLNWMRWLGLSAGEIAHVIRARAADRYEGQAQNILDKYAKKFGI